MKKVVLCAAIGAVFTCEGMDEKALVLRDSSSKAVVHMDMLESEIRRQEQESRDSVDQNRDLVKRINYQEITNQTVSGDQLTVTVQDFLGDESVGESYNRSYPIQKMFLEYTHDFEKGVSHPVEELFAVVNDLEYSDIAGKFVVDSEFVNEEESLTHQLRIDKNSGTNGYQMNDAELKATPFMETFIETENWEEVIGEAKLREDKVVAYEKIEGSEKTTDIGPRFSKPGDDEFEYQQQKFSEDWKRPDGSIFTKETVKDTPIAKQKPADPKPAHRQHVVNQTHHSGRSSNDLEAAGQAIRDNCIIM